MTKTKDDAVALIMGLTKDKDVATQIIDRLEANGLLKLSYGNPEIAVIIEAFKDCFGTTKTTKYDRFAAMRLAKAHGAQEVAQVVRLLSQYSDDQYIPRVNNVSQLEEKWVSVVAYLKRTINEGKEIQL